MKHKKIILSLLLVVFSISATAQDENPNKYKFHWDFRLSAGKATMPKYAQYAFKDYDYNSSQTTENFPTKQFWMFRLEGDYQIHKLFRVGFWSSYGFVHLGIRPRDNSDFYKTHLFSNGISARVHLLPLFFERFRNNSPAVDIYAGAEIGAFYFRTKERKYTLTDSAGNTSTIYIDPSLNGGGHTVKTTATIGGGAFIYLTEQFGVFFDYQYGGFLTKKTVENSRALSMPKFGITLRF